MSCFKGWNRGFMYNSMTKTFVVETLKMHAEKLMLDREMSLLPATQPIVERIHRIHHLGEKDQQLKVAIVEKRRELREALDMLRRNRAFLVAGGLHMSNADTSISEALTDSDQSDEERDNIRMQQARLPPVIQQIITRRKTIHRELSVMEAERQATRDAVHRLVRLNRRRIDALDRQDAATQEYATSDSEGDGNTETRRQARSFVRSCPQEDCRGFLSQRWICGLCNTHVCSKCHETKQEKVEHTCNPDNVATAQLLVRDTKGCPKCGTQIHKIDGCNMMFCTRCHTPFCWRTGEIIKNERIHNPHYYEWLRQNSSDGTIPREPGDVPCDDRITIRMIRNKLEQADLLSYDLEDILWNVHRICLHIEMEEVPRLRNRINVSNVDMRIRYMMNECSEKAWRHELYKRAKQSEKNAAICEIYEMVLMVVNNEMLGILQADPLIFQKLTDSLAILHRVREYANQQFLEVSRLYQCTVPKIEEDMWQLGRQRAEHSVKSKRKREGERELKEEAS
jgi:hypothetical protein